MVLLLLTFYKFNVINSYEDDKQAEVNEQVIEDAKNIQDLFNVDNPVIDDSVDRMLKQYEDKLWGAEFIATDAYEFHKGNTNMGAQNRMRDLQINKTTMPYILPDGINADNPCHKIPDCTSER